MLPFQSYYGFGRGEGLFPGIGSIEMDGGGSSLGSRSTAETKAMAACKSHSEAERRRRERINGHLATLRTLLPNTTKTDKASLLAEVVQHVKELKRHAADAAPSSSNNIWPFPGETDEVTLDPDPRSSLIKASVCCDDRPDLLSDLNGAIRSLRLRAVRAEITTVGGRTKSVFLIEGRGGDDECSTIRRALKAVLEKRAAVSTTSLSASGAMLPGNKRPRLSRQLGVSGF
ncbi:transcription factor bHLH30-like [Magnolia sinica]|uniref:transcription factor bHLH30-like n=1 Tax=Magnolia sinica TaxID=86752 RepID=UPI002658989A|nr:transcription factor bHLH30-like [Magnolia sinica]